MTSREEEFLKQSESDIKRESVMQSFNIKKMFFTRQQKKINWKCGSRQCICRLPGSQRVFDGYRKGLQSRSSCLHLSKNPVITGLCQQTKYRQTQKPCNLTTSKCWSGYGGARILCTQLVEDRWVQSPWKTTGAASQVKYLHAHWPGQLQSPRSMSLCLCQGIRMRNNTN